MRYLLLIFCLLSIPQLNAQGGAQLFTGLIVAQNQNLEITKENQFQSGFTIGLQSRLKDGVFVAGPGLKYTRISMFSTDELNFINKEENYHFIQMPLNVGLEYKIGWLKLRPYAGASATYFYKIDDNPIEINYDDIKDYFFNAHAGFGIDISWITLDLIYEKGITDAHAVENSAYNFLSLNLGFFF